MSAAAPSEGGGAEGAGRRITLLTDFGTADGYVAAMHGVIATVAPHVRIEDASHELAAGDVAAAAWALGRYWRLYPEGTVHVVVVDPGVGTERRALALRALGRYVVAPDNGVVTHVLEEARASAIVSIENARYLRNPVSTTFHGRDVFAPAAAFLAAGGDIHRLGPPLEEPVTLAVARPTRSDNVVHGTVLHVDTFGNLITNIPGDWIDRPAEVLVEGVPVGPVRTTYGSVAPGEPVALIGSARLVEVSVRDGSAAGTLRVRRGAEVVVRLDANPESEKTRR